MKRKRTKKLYAEVACGNTVTITRTGTALEVFVDGHPVVDISLITKRVFLYTTLKTHEREFVSVGNDAAYLAPMWGERIIQP